MSERDIGSLRYRFLDRFEQSERADAILGVRRHRLQVIRACERLRGLQNAVGKGAKLRSKALLFITGPPMDRQRIFIALHRLLFSALENLHLPAIFY